jgi:sigma-B regulation protein RsbU (phosphoserine phosphatase)
MRSLATKLTVYILSLTLLMLAVTFVVMYRFNSTEVKHHAEKYAMSLLKNTVSDVSWDFRDVEHIMAANEQQVKAIIATPDSAMRIIEDIISSDNMIMGASVAFEPYFYPERGGHFMLYANLDSLNVLHRRCITDTIEYDYHRMPWYADARRTGHSVWSEPYYDEGCGDRLMTTYSIPLKDAAGKVYGVFTADVSLVELVSEINRLRTFDDDYTFVLTGKGNYVAHSSWVDIDDKSIMSRGEHARNAEAAADSQGSNSDSQGSAPAGSETTSDDLSAVGARMMRGESGMARITLNGEDMLVCYCPLQVADWSIGYACSYSSILASLNTFTLSTELGLLLVLLLLMLTVRWIIKRQMRPVEALTAATYTISKGDFNTSLPEITTNDEFHRLHDAFEAMQTSLKQYIKDLTEVTAAKQRISSELSIAHDIQMSLIPPVSRPTLYPQLQLGALLRPAKEVGGDFYDFLIRDGQLFFTIADVSGKGVPASLIMATTRAHFRMMCQVYASAETIVKKLNHALAEDNDTNMFVTMFVGVLNLSTYDFNFCNAGHNPAVMVNAEGSRLVEVKPNLPLGVIDDFDYQGQSTQLTPDTMLLFYTDGLTEAENPRHELLGEQEVVSLMAAARHLSVDEVIARLTARVERFADGAEQSDDLTMFSVKLGYKLEMQNTLSAVDLLPAFINEVCGALPIPPDTRAERCSMLNLALEEALVNVISYAYPAGTVGPIRLTAEIREASVLFTLVDSGRPFDPTTAADPDISLPLEQREVGGLGILLMRKIMVSVAYRRVDGNNELTLTWSL